MKKCIASLLLASSISSTIHTSDTSWLTAIGSWFSVFTSSVVYGPTHEDWSKLSPEQLKLSVANKNLIKFNDIFSSIIEVFNSADGCILTEETIDTEISKTIASHLPLANFVVEKITIMNDALEFDYQILLHQYKNQSFVKTLCLDPQQVATFCKEHKTACSWVPKAHAFFQRNKENDAVVMKKY